MTENKLEAAERDNEQLAQQNMELLQEIVLLQSTNRSGQSAIDTTKNRKTVEIGEFTKLQQQMADTLNEMKGF